MPSFDEQTALPVVLHHYSFQQVSVQAQHTQSHHSTEYAHTDLALEKECGAPKLNPDHNTCPFDALCGLK